MRKFCAVFAMLGALVLAPASAPAQVLINGNLDLPGIHESDATVGWTLTENPATSNTATFASFANHTPDDGNPLTTQTGLWLRSFEGLFFGNLMEPVDAQLSQIVAGAVPGVPYAFSGWSRWEANYSGGQTTLATGPLMGQPSPTGTFMEMRFVDAANAGLSSVLLDLRTEQTNNNTWKQHTISGTAPAGTVGVLVTAYATDMVPTSGGQSAFFDDFTLTVIPEPGSLALAGLALVGMASARRRK